MTKITYLYDTKNFFVAFFFYVFFFFLHKCESCSNHCWCRSIYNAFMNWSNQTNNIFVSKYNFKKGRGKKNIFQWLKINFRDILGFLEFYWKIIQKCNITTIQFYISKHIWIFTYMDLFYSIRPLFDMARDQRLISTRLNNIFAIRTATSPQRHTRLYVPTLY